MARITNLGLKDYVTLLGAVNQESLADEYRQAAVTVMTDVDEGFGMALVEAQLCGSPVVGTQSGGITDIIADGETGLLFEVGDSTALAQHLQTLLSKTDMRNRLARQGAISARQNFSAYAIARKFRGWYEELSR